MFTVNDARTGKKIGSYLVNVKASTVVDDMSFAHGYGFYSNPNNAYTFRFIHGYARGVYKNLKIKDPLEKMWIARQIFLYTFPMTEFKQNNKGHYVIKTFGGKTKTIPQSKWLEFVKKSGYGLSSELESHPFHKQTMTRSAFDKKRFRIDKVCSMIDMGVLEIRSFHESFSGKLMHDSILVDKKGKKVSLRQAVEMWDKKFKGHKVRRPQYKTYKNINDSMDKGFSVYEHNEEVKALRKAKGKEVYLKGHVSGSEQTLNNWYTEKDLKLATGKYAGNFKKGTRRYFLPYHHDKYKIEGIDF